LRKPHNPIVKVADGKRTMDMLMKTSLQNYMQNTEEEMKFARSYFRELN
jgi:hypothetical protein